jgi:malate dehydrogenase (oxaloacetate-decarboxylating)
MEKGGLGDALKGADVFIGVAGPGILSADMVKGMASGAIVFAMANPTPEIFPDEAKAGGAAIVATGRSDFPNQVNNSLGFPGLFRGALDVRASVINEEMKLAAAYAIASLIPDSKLTPELILPETMDPRVAPVVAESVAQAARDSGVARI